jgi:hypothetical protein
MDAKGEAKAHEDGLRHAEEYRQAHGISLEEWELAEAMTKDLQEKHFREFWELYDGRAN